MSIYLLAPVNAPGQGGRGGEANDPGIVLAPIPMERTPPFQTLPLPMASSATFLGHPLHLTISV